MGALSSLRSRRISNDGYNTPGGWLHAWLAGEDDAEALAQSGVRVSESSALKIADVYKCVRVASDAFAVLPLKIREIVEMFGEAGAIDATDQYLWPLLHDEPNKFQTSFHWRKQIMCDIMTWGNHYSFIERYTYNGRVAALRPLVPGNTRIDTSSGEPVYYTRSSQTNQEERFEYWEILHFYGLGYNGICGASPIRLQMEAMGLAKATERFGASYFGNGSRSGLIAMHPGVLGKEGRERVRKSIEEVTKGPKNWHRTLVLEEGLKVEKTTIPNNEAQFLETRKYQRAEIAGLYGVPLHKIMDLDRSTNNNIEHTDLEWHRDGVMPHLVSFEQEARRKLLTAQEKKKFFIEFEFKAQMRGDTASQTQHIREMINSAVYTPNMGLKFLGLNPYEGGNRRYIQLNMIPVDKLDEFYESQQESSPAEEESRANPPKTPRRYAENLVQSAVKKAYGKVFRDAVGRIVNRAEKTKGVYATTSMMPLLSGLADGLGLRPILDDEKLEEKREAELKAFLLDYAQALAIRAKDWTEVHADTIAAQELDRATIALIERGRP
jgi:HK97 family phage portal protein